MYWALVLVPENTAKNKEKSLPSESLYARDTEYKQANMQYQILLIAVKKYTAVTDIWRVIREVLSEVTFEEGCEWSKEVIQKNV